MEMSKVQQRRERVLANTPRRGAMNNAAPRASNVQAIGSPCESCEVQEPGHINGPLHRSRAGIGDVSAPAHSRVNKRASYRVCDI